MTRFTVVVATFGRPDRLRTVLERVDAAARATGASHDVVVADNHPEYAGEEVVRAFQPRTNCDVKYLRTPPCNKCAALNTAVDVARTEWLAFTDDDTLPDEQWLFAADAVVRAGEFRMFGGRIDPGEQEGRLPSTLSLRNRYGTYPGGGVFVAYRPRPDSGPLGPGDPVPLGANVFISKAVFAAYGGYDERLWRLCGKAALGVDDGEFGVRVKRGGERIGYCHEALVVHPIHVDKFPLGRRVGHTFRNGYQNRIVLWADDRAVLPPYLLRKMAGQSARSLGYLLKGNRSEAASELLESSRTLGYLCARWTRGYRARVASFAESGE